MRKTLGMLLFLLACTKTPATTTDTLETTDVGADTTTDAGQDAATATDDWRQDGPHPVGTVDFELTDAKRARKLRVTMWYPAAESARKTADSGMNLADFYAAESPEHATMTTLLAQAPACVRTKTHSAPGVDAEGKNWPLIAFSHCHSCTRFESTTIAERLASHGIAVVAPDHTGNTIFEGLANKAPNLTAEWLQTREDDMRFVLDQVLDAQNAAIPLQVRGKLDAAKVGGLGHSFGGVTTGKLVMDDARLKAGFALAVPMENPLLPGVEMAKIHVPVGFLLAREDNSILEIGNGFIRDNFAAANPPAWLIEVADAGHFSFADIAGLTSFMTAGCGQGQRMADQTAFTYLDNTVARTLAARIVGAFFGRNLLGQSAAEEPLMALEPPGVVSPSERL